jgi:Na+/melibiose symporter-like transporter
MRIGFLSIFLLIFILFSSLTYASDLPGLETYDEPHIQHFLLALNTASFGVNAVSFIGSFDSSTGCKLLGTLGLTIGATSLLYLSQLEETSGLVVLACTFNSFVSLANMIHGFMDNSDYKAIKSHNENVGLWINRENDLGFRISLDF